MNRIVIIGNGFDLAHGLKTSYKDFIEWYWAQWMDSLRNINDKYEQKAQDKLCCFKLKQHNIKDSFQLCSIPRFINDQREILLVKDKDSKITLNHLMHKVYQFFEILFSPFFNNITQAIENKGWVDIENEYYQLLSNQREYEDYSTHPDKLNEELNHIKDLLWEYLTEVQKNYTANKTTEKLIERIIFEPIKYKDIEINVDYFWQNFMDSRIRMQKSDWQNYFIEYHSSSSASRVYETIQKCKSDLRDSKEEYEIGCKELTLPDHILLLNFNYTNIADSYLPMSDIFSVNHIHGNLKDPESIIFGYGDELDESYKKIINKNENVYLQNIKSIKYLESDNYRKLLQFIESDAYQIYIMGHSCGNSDRTLLNTLFEHPNCVSIKPFYFLDEVNNKDNYTDIVQNISRNFTDMKLMRDRVVNKTYCEPFSIKEK